MGHCVFDEGYLGGLNGIGLKLFINLRDSESDEAMSTCEYNRLPGVPTCCRQVRNDQLQTRKYQQGYYVTPSL